MPNEKSASSFGMRLLTHIGITFFVGILIITATIFLRTGTANKISLVVEKNRAIGAYGDSVNNLAELKKAFGGTEIERATLNQILPTRDRLLKVPKEIRLEAQKLGVNAVMTLGTEFEAEDNSLPGIAFQLTTDGAIETLISFMDKLKKLPYLMSLDSVNVSGEENKSSLAVSGKLFSKN